MASSGMSRRVALVRYDVSKELSASTIRVTLIGELGTTSAVTRNRHPLLVTLMAAPSSSETSVLKRDTRRNIPEDADLHTQRRENLKAYRNKFIGRNITFTADTGLINNVVDVYLLTN
jgi:hypothetical protein